MHLSWNGHRHLTADSLIWSRCETIFLIEILKTRQPCSCYHVWVVTRGPPAERTYSQNGLLLVHTTRERFVLHCEAHAQFVHAATWSIKTRSSFSSNSVRARSSVDIVLLLCFISSCTRGATCQVPPKKNHRPPRFFVFLGQSRHIPCTQTRTTAAHRKQRVRGRELWSMATESLPRAVSVDGGVFRARTGTFFRRFQKKKKKNVSEK